MARILISPQAKNDLLDIGQYIAFTLQNKTAARKLIQKIHKTVSILEQSPNTGTPLGIPATPIVYRYLICDKYMFFYHLIQEAAHVDRILYGRRDYLTLLFDEELIEEN